MLVTKSLLLLIVPLAAGLQAQSLVEPIPSAKEELLSWRQRLTYGATSSFSAKQFAGMSITSGISTARNQPEEFGPGWSGYGKRFGTRMLSGFTGSMMEVGIGSLWNEDPRYYRAGEGVPVKSRITHALKMTVMARGQDGHLTPAYARFISVPLNSAFTNTFRPESDRTAGRTIMRVPMNFLGRIVSNSISEFWPDLNRHVLRRGK